VYQDQFDADKVSQLYLLRFLHTYDMFTYASLKGKFTLPSSIERVNMRRDIEGVLFSYIALLLRKILSAIPEQTQTSGPVIRFKANVNGFKIEIVRIGITMS
jgi:hypothetical protein